LEDEHKTVVGIIDSGKKRNVWLIACVGFLVIAMGTLILVVVLHYTHKKNLSTPVATGANACSSPAAGSILKNAAANFNVNNAKQLGTIVTSIKKLPNYQNDPNCLYVIIMYNLNANNLSAAQNYLNQFNKLYTNEPLNIYLSQFGGATTLRQYVASSLTAEKDLNSRVTGVSSHQAGKSK
jgi:hypothetical protein